MNASLQSINAPKILRQAGWTWTPSGLVVTMRFRGGRIERVLLPITTVEVIFGNELQREGIAPAMAVGASAYSVGGFFKRIGSRIKKMTSGKAFGFVRRVGGRIVKVAKKEIKEI